MVVEVKNRRWALILGASSGLGLATAKKLARHDFDLVLVHRDRRSQMEQINKEFKAMEAYGATVISFNMDALNTEKQDEILRTLQNTIGQQKISVLVHSIAKGTLKPLYSEDETVLQIPDFEITISAMALSLYDWSKKLISQKLLESDCRILAFTSEGSTKAIPNYAAVAVAKTALERLVKSMAVEFAPIGIKVNCIQAGVTDTTSFRMIPNSDQIAAKAKERNPNKRLTLPDDVANAVYLLTLPEASWITGNIIKVDGGEHLC